MVTARDADTHWHLDLRDPARHRGDGGQPGVAVPGRASPRRCRPRPSMPAGTGRYPQPGAGPIPQTVTSWVPQPDGPSGVQGAASPATVGAPSAGGGRWTSRIYARTSARG